MTEPALNDDYSHGAAVQWSKWLGDVAGKPGLHFLEIGSYEGCSARWFLKNILTDPTSDIVCVDTFKGGGPMAEFKDDELLTKFLATINPWRGQVVIVRDTSDTALRYQLAVQNHFDLVYIDGSHVATDVLKDSVLAWPTLKVGGMVIWDDYGWEGLHDPIQQPKLAVDAFLACYDGKYEVVGKEWQVAIRKVKE